MLAFSVSVRYQGAMKHDGIDQLAQRLAAALPQGVRNMRDELEQNFRSILQAGLDRFDLVTREEFDVQQAVLARTREKLEAFEARVAALEAPPEETVKKRAAKKTAKKKATKKKSAKKKTAKRKKTTSKKR